MAEDVQANIGLKVDTSQALAGLKALQSEISALHVALAKMGPSARAGAAGAQRALIDNINATGKFAASMTTVKTTAESFTTALEKNKLTMGEYFRYAGGASKSFGKSFAREFATIEKVAVERVKTLQTQYIKLGRDASGAMRAIAVRPLALDMDNLQTKTAIAAQKQQLLNQLLKQGSTQMLNWGKNTQWAGRQLMVGFSIPLGLFASKAMQSFADLEKQMISFKRVYGDLGTTAKETDAMAESIKNLALEFTKYGVAVSDTMDMAAKAAAMGKTGADLISQVQQANNLAVLGQVDQQKALETTITMTNTFGTATEDLGKKINFLNAVENQTVLSIEDMTTAIPKAGPVIKQLGGNVEDLAFFLTAMKEGGINASEGANALKSGLASMINPTAKAKKMLSGFGIDLEKIVKTNKGDVRGTVTEFAKALDKLDPLNRAKAIEQLFGKFQFARISTLMKNVASDSSQAATTAQLAQKSSIELAAISAREMRKISSSPLYKFQKAIQDFQAAMAPIGESFMKFVTPIINWVNGLLKSFNSLGDGTKTFIIGFTSIVAGLGPILLMTFGLIANGFANIIKGFAGLKSIFNKVQTSSEILGQETNYMTEEQMKAKAVAASLDQVHGKLVQTFNVEAQAVNSLAAAYERAVVASQSLMPSSVSAPGTGNRKASGKVKPRVPRKFAEGGIFQGPGTETSDSIVAMVSRNEAIIPAKSVRKYPSIVSALIDGNIPGFSKGTKKKRQSNRNMETPENIIRLFQSKTRSKPRVGKLSFASQMKGMSWGTFDLENEAADKAAFEYLVADGMSPEEAAKLVAQKYTGMDLAHTNPKYRDRTIAGRTFKEKLWTAAPGDTTPDLRTFNQFFADRVEKTVGTPGKTYKTGSYIGDILQDRTRIDHIVQQSGLSRTQVIKELKKFQGGQYPQPNDQNAWKVFRGFAAGEKGAGAAATVAGIDARLSNWGKAGSHGAVAKAGGFTFDPAAEKLGQQEFDSMAKSYEEKIQALEGGTKSRKKQAKNEEAIAKETDKQLVEEKGATKSAKQKAAQYLKDARLARDNGARLTKKQKEVLASYDTMMADRAAKGRATRAANKAKSQSQTYLVSGVDQYVVDGSESSGKSSKKPKTPRASRPLSSRFSKFSGLGSIFSMSQGAQSKRAAGATRLFGGMSFGKAFGLGSAVSIGGNIVGGMVGGKTGESISGTSDALGTGIMMFGPLLAKAAPALARFIPVIGAAVTAFQVVSLISDKMTERDRLNTQYQKDLSNAMKATTGNFQSAADFFGHAQKDRGYYQKTSSGATDQVGFTSAVNEYRQLDTFKTDFGPIVDNIKSIMSNTSPDVTKEQKIKDINGVFQNLGVRLGADYGSEEVSVITEAIKQEAGVTDLPLEFKTIDFSSKKESKKSIKTITSYLKDVADQTIATVNPIKSSVTDAISWSDADKAKFVRYADAVKTSMTTLTAAFDDGKITAGRYKKALAEISSQFESMKPEAKTQAIYELSNAILATDTDKMLVSGIKNKTTQFKILTAAVKNYTKAMQIAAKVRVAQAVVDKYAGQENLNGGQARDLSNALASIENATKELDKLIGTSAYDPKTDPNPDPYGTGKDTLTSKQQARQKKWQDAMSLINLQEEQINKKYEDRVAALDKVNELNKDIAASQKDQLDLADALSRGDIAAAARAAQTMRANDTQRSYEDQKRALEQAQKNEIAALTVLINGKYYTKDQIQGKLDYYEKTSLTNAIKNNTVSVATGGMVKHYEPGGGVRGPGTGTSDSIPAMLSNGEYVIRAKAAQALGLDTLNQMNHAEKFAKGGKAKKGISPLLNFRIQEHRGKLAPWFLKWQEDYKKAGFEKDFWANYADLSNENANRKMWQTNRPFEEWNGNPAGTQYIQNGRKLMDHFASGGTVQKLYAGGQPEGDDIADKNAIKNYIKKPLTLHNDTEIMSRKTLDDIISRRNLKIAAGTDLIRVAADHDMKVLSNMKPGQSAILDRFLSVTTGDQSNFIEGMKSGNIDTGGRSGSKQYPLIKFNVKSAVPGVADLNSLLDSPESNVVDGLLGRGQVMKLRKISTASDGSLTYHVDLGGKSKAKLGFNELGLIQERSAAYKELLSLEKSGALNKKLGYSSTMSPKTTAQDLSAIRIREQIPNMGAIGSRVLGSIFKIFGRVTGPEGMALSDALFGTHNLPLAGPKPLVSQFPSGAFAGGGMVSRIKPSYFANGDLARGTDIIPAMLTPGEFVMSRSAVQNFGVDNLRAINTGVSTPATSMGESVYNYSINVNVSSNSDANEIARTVMAQIRRVDSQRVRGL